MSPRTRQHPPAARVLRAATCIALLLAATALAAGKWPAKVAEFVDVMEQGGRLREADRLRKQLVAGGDPAVEAMMHYLRTSPEPKPGTWESVIGCVNRSKAKSSTAALAELLVKGRERQRRIVAKSLAWWLKHRMGPELIPPLEKALADPIPIVRVNAAIALKRRGDESGFALLLEEAEALSSQASRLAQGALGRLPWKDKKRIVQSVRRQLASLDRGTRSHARDLGLRLKAPALEALIKANRAREVDQATDICNLGKRGDDAAVRILVRLMDRNLDQRLVARALIYAGNRRAVDGLIELLDSRTNAVRQHSGIVLRRLTGQLFGDRRKDLWTSWWAEHRDEYLANPAAPRPRPTAEQAKRARALLALLADRNTQQRALDGLGKLGPAAVLPVRRHLLELHGDYWSNSQGGNRRALLPLLARLGKPGLDELGRLSLLGGPHDWVRRPAWEALRKADPKAAADFALRAIQLGSALPTVAIGLQRCCYAGQAPAIRRSIADERTLPGVGRVCILAHRALHGRSRRSRGARFGVQVCTPYQSLRQEVGLRLMALEAVASIDAARLGPLFDAALATLDAAAIQWRVGQLAKKRPGQVAPALERLRGGTATERRRAAAAAALVELGRPGAVKAIVPFLKSNDEAVRRAAVLPFCQGGGGPVLAEIGAVALTAKSADLRRSAVYALHHSRKREAIPALIEALKDREPRVVEEVLRGLDALTGLGYARNVRGHAQLPAAAARYARWWKTEGHKPTAIEDAWERRLWAERDGLTKRAKSPFGKELRPELVVPVAERSSLGMMLQYLPGLCLASFGPGARHVAFLREREREPEGVELVLMDRRRRKARKLGLVLPSCVAFSPGGTALAVAAIRRVEKGGAIVLAAVDAASGKMTILIRLTHPHDGGRQRPPAIPSCMWLDERRVAAYVFEAGVPRLVVYDTVRRRETELANLAEAARRIPSKTGVKVDERWTVLGEYLSASSAGDVYACWAGRVFRVDARTKKTACVLDPPFRAGYSSPRVDPAGRFLVVQGGGGSTAMFVLCKADGSALRLLATFELRGPQLSENFANWFPDGRHLALTSLDVIHLFSADGTHKVSIPVPEVTRCLGVWPVSPDTLVALTQGGFWRLHVGRQLRQLDDAARRRTRADGQPKKPPQPDGDEPEI